LTRRTVYVLPSNGDKPTVWIESLKDGQVTFGVKASGRSLGVSRRRAQVEFRALQQFVVDARDRALKQAMKKSGNTVKEAL
jgi:hypothetical protein